MSEQCNSFDGLTKQVKDAKQVFKQENDAIRKELREWKEWKSAMNKELRKLREELAELQQNKKEKKQPSNQQQRQTSITVPALPATSSDDVFHLSLNVMIAGLERFVEHDVNTGHSPTTTGVLPCYHRYVEWFDFLQKKVYVNDELCYRCAGYLFLKVRFFGNKPDRFLWRSYTGKKKEIRAEKEDSQWIFNTCTLNEGWNHTNTKFALVLHPSNAQKIIELRKYGFDSKFEEWICENISSDYYSNSKDLIVCCKKN